MTTFKDVFRRSFLEGFASAQINSVSVASALLTTALLGLYIFLTYRVVTRKTFYSKNFNISLVGVAMVTAAIIVTIQSSIVVSLGMVGALSIVRFRTAIKDPMDLMYLFWSISTGIICGAGFAEYAILLALSLTLVVLVLDRIPLAKAPMILVVNAEKPDGENAIMDVVKQYARYANVKSRNLTASSLDMTIEVRTDKGSELVLAVLKAPTVRHASLLEHDGEVTF